MKKVLFSILLALPLCVVAQTKIATTVDQSVTGTTPTTANTLQFSVIAGETYHVTGKFIVTGTAGVGGNINFNSPVFSIPSGFSGNLISPNALGALFPGSANSLQQTSPGYRVTGVDFCFTAATSGTFSFSFYASAAANTTTLKQGSYIIYELL